MILLLLLLLFDVLTRTKQILQNPSPSHCFHPSSVCILAESAEAFKTMQVYQNLSARIENLLAKACSTTQSRRRRTMATISHSAAAEACKPAVDSYISAMLKIGLVDASTPLAAVYVTGTISLLVQALRKLLLETGDRPGPNVHLFRLLWESNSLDAIVPILGKTCSFSEIVSLGANIPEPHQPVEVACHAHPLTVLDGNIVHAVAGGMWMCDGCNEKSEARFMRHCAQCDYDLCRSCFEKWTIPVETSLYASALASILRSMTVLLLSPSLIDALQDQVFATSNRFK